LGLIRNRLPTHSPRRPSSRSRATGLAESGASAGAVDGVRSGARTPRQVEGEPLQGRRELVVGEVPERPTCRVLTQNADGRQDLVESHVG